MSNKESRARVDAFLLSVGLVVPKINPDAIEILKKIEQFLSRDFEFWELLIVTPFSRNGDKAIYTEAATAIQNVRMLRVADIDNFYTLRLAIASEAIGDVVILTSLDEATVLDISRLAKQVYERDDVVIFSRKEWAKSLVVLPILSLISGFNINKADTLTIGFPRSWLSLALGRRDAALLLRFEKPSSVFSFNRESVPDNCRLPRSFSESRRRFNLLTDLLSNSSFRILQGLAAVSYCVTLGAIFYGLYVVMVWLFKSDVSPGWLTTSLVQISIASFLGISVAAISMSLLKIFERLDGVVKYSIVDELNSVDLFKGRERLNVEVGNGRSISPNSYAE